MPGEMRAVVRGVKEAEAALVKMDANIDVATLKALKACQGLARKSIKGQLRGRPRWDHRGKSSRTGDTVRLNLNPHVVAKSGGPGRLTGALSRSIRSNKKPMPLPGGGFNGVVFAGGRGGPQNLYKGQLEGQFPYFKPGVDKAEPKMAGIWAAAWGRATEKL
ncbi:hypothetical protein ABZW30_12380 [Kitasatospora sp. NPDC004669]|uniref:hypothetical protein n=1 Tax=Kitasatospora sp. NPDC004669 TaxID=3154555 RepID=UPI00339E2F2E